MSDAAASRAATVDGLEAVAHLRQRPTDEIERQCEEVLLLVGRLADRSQHAAGGVRGALPGRGIPQLDVRPAARQRPRAGETDDAATEDDDPGAG